MKHFFHKCFLNHQIHDIPLSEENDHVCSCPTEVMLEQQVKKSRHIFKDQNYCSVCKKKFTSLVRFKNHKSKKHQKNDVHLKNNYFECPICGKQFKRKTVGRRHMIHMHTIQDKIYECNICHIKFNRSDSLKRHCRIKHNEEDSNLEKEVFECDICGKKFLYKVSIERHLSCIHMPKEKFYTCTKCNITFTYLYGLKRHFKTKHCTSNEVDFECDICGMKFRRRDNLKRHQAVHEAKHYECSTCHLQFNRPDTLKLHEKKKHPKNDADVEVEDFICDHCGKNFSAKSCVKQHIINVHLTKRIKKVSLSRNKCAKCDMIFRLKSDLLFHYQKVHSIQVESEHIRFDSFTKFITWKKEMEKQTWCAYNRLFTRRRHSQAEIMTYICHRSGMYTPVTQRKRRLKQQGSKKIGALCPAELKLTINKDGTCEVKYTKTHVGHDVHAKELVHVRHYQDERNLIALKIAAGVPYSRIMKDMTNNLSNETSENLEKIHLLTRADIRNIASAKKLNKKKCDRMVSKIDIESYIEQYDDTVLYYKKVGELDEQYRELMESDFILIVMNKEQKCMLRKYTNNLIAIDGTYGLSRYDYILQSLMILDDKRQAFPCCFMFTNRNDENLVDVMLQCIRSEVGTLSTNVLLTDVHEMYHNSWIRIMNNEPLYRLFSPWHVKRIWRKYLTKIKSSSKRKNITRLLYNDLLRDFDRTQFEKKLVEFLNNDDPDIISFKYYFRDHFVENKMQWAFCYRIQAGIDENIRLESFHDIIKNIYAEGNKIRNLKDALQILQCYMNDKISQMTNIETEEIITSSEMETEKIEEIYIIPSYMSSDENENKNEIEDTVEEFHTTYIIKSDDNECVIEQLQQQKYFDYQLYCNECDANMCTHIGSLCVLFPNEENENLEKASENIVSNEFSELNEEMKPLVELKKNVENISLRKECSVSEENNSFKEE